MKAFKVNLHLLEQCNFNCRFCYAHFAKHTNLKVNDWLEVVDNCMNSAGVSYFNLAGGEPLLFNGLDQLIAHISERGALCSIITNGFRMDEKWIRANVSHLDTIGFSIDSIDEELLRQMGRATHGGKILTKERLAELCSLIKEVNPNCKIKINTVVSAYNKDELLGEFVRSLPISRWKIFRICPFVDAHFSNESCLITDQEYDRYLRNNMLSIGQKILTNSEDQLSRVLKFENGMEVVIEREVRGGYLMIDAGGYLVDDTQNSNYVRVANCLKENFKESIEKLHFAEDLYFSRYA